MTAETVDYIEGLRNIELLDFNEPTLTQPEVSMPLGSRSPQNEEEYPLGDSEVEPPPSIPSSETPQPIQPQYNVDPVLYFRVAPFNKGENLLANESFIIHRGKMREFARYEKDHSTNTLLYYVYTDNGKNLADLSFLELDD